MSPKTLSLLIKEKSKKYGFHCGIAKAEFLDSEKERLENWLGNGFHGEMEYLEKNFDKRLDPRLLLNGCKSVISLIYNYFPKEKISTNSFKIAKYAYGEDYHTVIKDIINQLVMELQEEIGEFSFRIFTDSAPVLERAWARKAGLGWVGKNSLTISKSMGSYFFLAEILCDLELEYDAPFPTDYCGSCRRCIEMCPTQAIVNERIIDSRKCISYATIELKNEIPDFFNGKMNGWIFGCDICQEVCPWNRFSIPASEIKFSLNTEIQHFTKKDWKNLDEETFRKLFKNSALKRTKFSGLKRNILFNSELRNS